MKVLALAPDRLICSEDLMRSSGSKVFEERLEASISKVGLAEPIKVASLPSGKYLVVDGVMRLRAITSLRKKHPAAFKTIPAYQVDFKKRFEVRYQTDIYQDLLPSQLAALVEHLHRNEGVRKIEIASFIGVSPATLRNYTGLWRLLQRGGLFARLVRLMDVGVIPSSNPYAWLRLTAAGLRYVLETHIAEGERAETWVEERIRQALLGQATMFPVKFVEEVTDSLPSDYYREGEQVRTMKRRLGLRRAVRLKMKDPTEAFANLTRVSRRSKEPVLRLAARSLHLYLK
jgi:ParB-like chromosome segregation protein Spo0J